MKKRVLSLLLTLVLVLGLLPAGAFAADNAVAEYLSGLPLTADPGTGTTAWTVSGDMLKSGNKGKAYSSSTLKLTFTEDTQFSFEYKVSCEDKYDYFTINDGEKESGDLDWKTWSGEVQTGDTVTLVYKKDSSGDKYDDCVYLRNFSCGEGVTLTFHNGEETAAQTIYGAGAALRANTFTKDHAVFAGWSATVDGTVDYADGAFVSPTEPMDLYAVWTDAFVVTFVDGSKTTTQNVPENGTLDSLPTATGKTGYTFGGWVDGETEVMLGTVISGDVTCTAKYVPITYTIRFDANGGSGEMADMTAAYDETVTLPENAFNRDGYRFTGWNTSAYSSSAVYQSSGKVKNLKNKQDEVQTLYAIWTGLPVTVTVDLNDGSEPTERTCVVGQNYNYIYVDSDGSAKFSTLPDPKREGYNFKGWFTEPDGGDAITNQYKFNSTAPVTLYAHWAEAVTITFDANGGSCYTKSKSIDKGAAYGTLPSASLSGKKFDGWFTAPEDGEKAESTTVFTEDTTLYARYRPYQLTVSFDSNGGEGEMEPCIVPSGVPTNLPKNMFTRTGYRFVKWTSTLSQWSTPKYYEDEGEYTWSSSWNDSSATLYAVWEQTVFGRVCEAVEKALPADGILRPGDTPVLPTGGEGYTVAYNGADFVFPESGTAEVTFTVTVTDTSTGETESRDYTLTLYSAETVRAEAELSDAVTALTGNFTPVFGKDVNANTAVEAILTAKGYEGITVSVKEPGTSAYASIDETGNIQYYFNPGMTGTGGYFYTTFRLEKDGVTAEKRWYCNIGWDMDRAHEMLEQAALRVLVPEGSVSELKLLRHPLKEGGELKDSYTYSDVDTWATVTWTSGNPDLVQIGDYANYYGPYATTLNNPSPLPQDVTLVAAIKCNATDEVLYKAYTVTLAGLAESTAQSVREALLAKLEAGLASPGLTDQVTGEPLDSENVVHDILFPTTRDFKIDGKYYPVTITSSNPDVIVAPDMNNAARVEVYRPMPGKDPVEVTLTITITEKSSGIAASKDIPVTVQPLIQTEIDAELALMEQVKAHYFDGIKGGNPAADAITADLDYFFEVYAGENGELVWIRSNADRVNHGIVPVPMNGWEQTEQWRLFRSSNPEVISHENLLVTRQNEHKAVTVTSYLSSETLGRYAERYPENAQLQKLYYQPVSVDLVVTGTAPTVSVPAEERLTVTFTLRGNGSFGFTQTYRDLSEGTTVFEVFSRALTAHGYTYTAHGAYIEAITTPTGVTLSELDEGENSGWMYRINGAIPDAYMGARTLKNGDTIEVFYTGDFTHESGYMGGWDDVNIKDRETPLAGVPGFADVPGTAWYAYAVEYVCDEGLMVGVSRDRFAPGGDLSRAMLAAVLYRMEESPVVTDKTTFADVSDTWYTDAVCWGVENEILSGMGDGTFLPNRGVTRQELVSMLYRYARYLGMDIDEPQAIDRFSDAEEVSDWGYDAVSWAVANGLLYGTEDGRLNPNGNATRAEAAVILQRFAALK